ncbi:hypothetical protein H072_6590 [Dactylellina haptotyla CBS 200.50]|uniref:CBM1 domain-containing protein n=1 Tax=Dactylellina haptotyla (strain CBS 200.50) TaxID=1284197 RepID=S8BJW7_DACHA|nr:hypothetical protein H072_6590 [Dactylellina haptotyla CBS 200.50]
MMSRINLLAITAYFSVGLSLTITTTTATTTSNACPRYCADYLTSCGRIYGTCVPYCSGDPVPRFTDPCSTPKTTTMAPITTTTSATSKACPLYCADYLTSCGHLYGTCVPYCPGDGAPRFTDPCSKTTTLAPITTTTSTTSTTSKACPLYCADYLTSCGHLYGTCVPYCSGDPAPRFTDPCSTPKSTPAPTTTSGPVNGAYGQCGGIGWSGNTLCPTGYTCAVLNPYYNQCLPLI